MKTSTSYGKQRVPVYRTGARRLEGLAPIPESAFVGRENRLFACEVDLEVFGDAFLPSYTEGDNRAIVATDSMKNFVLRQALAYPGATLEGFLHFCGQAFMQTYAQVQELRASARELPFLPAPVPGGAGGFAGSELLFARQHGDHAVAALGLVRAADGGVLVGDHRCGRAGLQLIKTRGASFVGFVRDEHTTLPELHDRPLFVYLDVYWRYRSSDDMLAEDHRRYVAAEQVRDLVGVVFDGLDSRSIQQLVHRMAHRILERFDQLAEVSLVAQNRTWDRVAESPHDERVKVYTDPRPAHGEITLTVSR